MAERSDEALRHRLRDYLFVVANGPNPHANRIAQLVSEADKRGNLKWLMRRCSGQEFVIAGYTPSSRNFDAIIFGYYDAGRLIYAGRTRNGFTPSSRDRLFKYFKGLEVEKCPFANLPEAKAGHWGEGLTAEKMKDADG